MRATKVFVTGIALIAGTLFTATPAHATWNDPKVNVSGHLDCGGAQEATWVWYEASNGEHGWADTSKWTSVNGWCRAHSLSSSRSSPTRST
ncbi:hypothetical protein CLV43_1143 [Umezawaea tangerina]|uniref:Secreted protein n=1 Tax=Umezawaea tangerina TaxID=84725 RepID=A0A2T0SNV0_9PSEU|nr:hypothetical protein CLV43_1143 [Umezawaea tangerina]